MPRRVAQVLGVPPPGARVGRRPDTLASAAVVPVGALRPLEVSVCLQVAVRVVRVPPTRGSIPGLPVRVTSSGVHP